MRRFVVFCLLVSSLVLSGCSTQKAPNSAQPSVQSTGGPTLTVKAAPGRIRLNQVFPVKISVTGAQPGGAFAVSLIGIAGIEAETESVQATADRQGKAELRVNATVSTRNHSSLVVVAEVAGETLSTTLDIVFDSKGNRAAAKKVGATATEGKQIDIQAYYDALPHTSDSNYVVAYERDKHKTGATKSGLSTASTDDAGDLPDTLLVDNITYLLPDGTESEPFSGIEYYIPDTGSGEPSPEDIEGGPQDGDGGLSTQATCTTTRTYTQFSQMIDGASQPMPGNTYVRVVDYNGIWPDRILAQGFTSGDAFWYNLPSCDTAGGSTRPDIYFIFETRTDNGLTASHGTFARRHWWRTATYYDVSQLTRPNSVVVKGANSEAIKTQRLWYKVNEVRDWERSATGVTFRADVLYPVFTYFGAAVVSRAALGQIQVVYGDALVDPTVFHEYGHLAYYRKMMGESSYNREHGCNLSGACASFPLCGGCIGHTQFENIGPEAAMIEGWADFFAALTTRVFYDVTDSFQVENSISSWPTGPGNEARVAAFLWDMWDNVGVTNDPDPRFDNRDGFSGSSPNDPVSPTGGLTVRYKKVAGYFTDMPLSSELKDNWLSRIKPTLSGQSLTDHCKILKFNTLNSIDTSCP